MTIAQQLKVKEFPFVIKDSNGKQIYYEDSDGWWFKYEYDSNGNQIYTEYSSGYWCKHEYDSKGNEIYFEDSDGYIEDNRPKQKEYTIDEIAKALGVDVNQLKIKK